jgi:hypothetical protein
MRRLLYAVLLVALVGACSSGHVEVKPGVSTTSSPARLASTVSPKQAAVALANRMVGDAVLPGGATRSTASPPRALRGPSSLPGMGNLVQAHRLWLVAEAPHAAYEWLQAHTPHGFAAGGRESGSGPDGASWGLDDRLVTQPANISYATLSIGVASDGGTGAVVRVDAVVGWTAPRPANEIVSSRDRTVIVSVVHVFEQGSPVGKRVVTSDPKLVQPIVRIFNRLRVEPPGFAHGCPAIGEHSVSYRIEFATAPTAKPDIVATIGKCGGPGVTVDGRAAPGLVASEGAAVYDQNFYDAVAHVLGFSEPHFD